jgi:hypothetical protein
MLGPISTVKNLRKGAGSCERAPSAMMTRRMGRSNKWAQRAPEVSSCCWSFWTTGRPQAAGGACRVTSDGLAAFYRLACSTAGAAAPEALLWPRDGLWWWSDLVWSTSGWVLQGGGRASVSHACAMGSLCAFIPPLPFFGKEPRHPSSLRLWLSSARDPMWQTDLPQ